MYQTPPAGVQTRDSPQILAQAFRSIFRAPFAPAIDAASQSSALHRSPLACLDDVVWRAELCDAVCAFGAGDVAVMTERPGVWALRVSLELRVRVWSNVWQQPRRRCSAVRENRRCSTVSMEPPG